MRRHKGESRTEDKNKRLRVRFKNRIREVEEVNDDSWEAVVILDKEGSARGVMA